MPKLMEHISDACAIKSEKWIKPVVVCRNKKMKAHTLGILHRLILMCVIAMEGLACMLPKRLFRGDPEAKWSNGQRQTLRVKNSEAFFPQAEQGEKKESGNA